MRDGSRVEPFLELDQVCKSFGRPRLSFPSGPRRRPAVIDLSLTLSAGETLALVGESGSGKTTVGRLALGLIPPEAGSVRLEGVDHRARSRAELRILRRRMQVIFQDTLGALDPRWPVGAQLREPLDIHGIGRPGDRMERAAAALRQVGLDPDLLQRLPRALSGGQRQRVVIARAMILEPDLVVCDEPVSALDLSVQARILALLEKLQRETQATFLFISHDLRVVRRLASRIAVMRAGRIVETGPTDAVLAEPRHEYTRQLLAAASLLDASAPRSSRQAADRP